MKENAGLIVLVLLVAAVIGGFLYSAANAPRHGVVDRDKMHNVYLECIDAIPKGPESTVYNDWDEVIQQCRDHAEEVTWGCIENCD